MDNNFNFNIINDKSAPQPAAVSQTFMANVFMWMTAALAITGIVAYQVGTSAEYIAMIYGNPILRLVIMLAPLGFVMLISGGFNRFSSTVLLTLYLVFSVLMGLSLSYIFLRYTNSTIYKTFGITAGMFGVMALTGYTTKTDLSKMGSILVMALVGIIIASLINMFTKSSGLDYIISFLGVIVFTGLTAYDVQKLKAIGSGTYGMEQQNKLAIMGAMNLYLDFVNLFLFMLRLFGGRKN